VPKGAETGAGATFVQEDSAGRRAGPRHPATGARRAAPLRFGGIV